MSRQRKNPRYQKLGDSFKLWDGWIIDEKGIHSPEGESFDPKRLTYFHWQHQIMSILRHRVNHPEQFNLF